MQTGVVVDALAPVGRWKVEPNGTAAITTQGTTAWHDYLTLLGDYALARGQSRPGGPLVRPGPERDALEAFFDAQWEATHARLAKWRERQERR